jgi:hypothetical protein
VHGIGIGMGGTGTTITEFFWIVVCSKVKTDRTSMVRKGHVHLAGRRFVGIDDTPVHNHEAAIARGFVAGGILVNQVNHITVEKIDHKRFHGCEIKNHIFSAAGMAIPGTQDFLFAGILRKPVRIDLFFDDQGPAQDLGQDGFRLRCPVFCQIFDDCAPFFSYQKRRRANARPLIPDNRLHPVMY